MFVVLQVVVAIKFYGEVVGRVAEREVLDAADGLPREGFGEGGREDGFALSIVVGYEAVYGGEAIGEFRG